MVILRVALSNQVAAMTREINIDKKIRQVFLPDYYYLSTLGLIKVFTGLTVIQNRPFCWH